ncbi:putative band 7 family protein R614 [Golovinomyces cichoracearum]|uniref:Putative band 7 family protein R614 n=1 Tax=Golovinomyces cichoracearum TaxID=62708 RepID=A0A420HSS1_9PEZI|nr:putative band 7 family protein R614 [Golovinomyces cichoracearum]
MPALDMDDISDENFGASSSTKGTIRKHPEKRVDPLINIQPPRPEDIQPKYERKIVSDSDKGHGLYGSIINSLGTCLGMIGAIPCCIFFPNPYKSVSQGNVGLVTKFGRFSRTVDPGLIRVNPLSERLIEIDVKIQITEVPQQVCMTKDNVTLHLTSVIYYHVISPHKVAFGISNVRRALIERTQTTIRHIVGARVLQDVIERREEIALAIEEIIEAVASGWGVQVESMLIKDINFSNELQESLSMAAQSKRIGESKIIAAQAEVESAKSMRQAADILSSTPAMQIRYLETMQTMAKTANGKVIFLPGIPATASEKSVISASKDSSGISSARKIEDQTLNDQDIELQRAINAYVTEII